MKACSPPAIFLFVATLTGCSEPGEVRHRISGDVVFDGQPIVFGEVLFTPDGAKANSGPQGIAYIRNGVYDTAILEGKGIAGGPTVIRVTGLTGPAGKLVCEYELMVDLPRSESTYRIEVPAAGRAPTKAAAPRI